MVKTRARILRIAFECSLLRKEKSPHLDFPRSASPNRAKLPSGPGGKLPARRSSGFGLATYRVSFGCGRVSMKADGVGAAIRIVLEGGRSGILR
jgi:hypothetical protein